LLAGAAFWLFRRRLRARDEAFRIVPQRADAYVAEVLAQSPVSIVRKPIASQINETAASPDAPTASTAAAAANVATPPIFPEIHFELPPFENAMSPAPDATPANPGAIADAATLAVIADIKSADEDARGRRFRYLSSRYQDIAIMMPPLDAPLRLLSQAGRINDEGAADFAKRFLKYAAYSRPYTEEYWLALLELLYREKFVNDYLVNAKWFREYHPDSTHWDEVQRIGYLLDPAAPVFASAAAWSHEEPVIGVWLPSNQSQAKSVTGRHELKLELAD
jgi:hypothetical protein